MLADDAPRLILADWLDENGGMVACDCKNGKIDPKRLWDGKSIRVADNTCPRCHGSGSVSNGCAERAEFIRVQCELARLKAIEFIDDEGLSWHSSTPEERRLEKRSAELLRERESKWVMDGLILPAKIERSNNSGIRHQWSRGFISHVTCTEADWIGRPCEVCNGTGKNRTYHPVEIEHVYDCGDCKGTGRIGAHGPAIVRAPVVACERVTLLDAVIHPSGGNDTYYVGGLGRWPKEFWSSMENCRNRQAALDSLSLACIEGAWMSA